MDSDDETEEMEAKPIVKKSGFAAFQMDDSEDNQATDSDEEAPVITKVRIFCFKFSLNSLRFSLMRETDTRITRAKSWAICKTSKLEW